MIKEELINNLLTCVELEGDGGCSHFTPEEKCEMVSFLNRLKKPIEPKQLEKELKEITDELISMPTGWIEELKRPEMSYQDVMDAVKEGYDLRDRQLQNIECVVELKTRDEWFEIYRFTNEWKANCQFISFENFLREKGINFKKNK